MTTTYEIAARRRKAAALVAVLRENGICASAARAAESHGWIELATTANVRPPSAATISLVLSILDVAEERPEPDCSCRRIDVDVDDARGCDVHDPQSASRRQAAQQLAAEWSEHPEPETREECPF